MCSDCQHCNAGHQATDYEGVMTHYLHDTDEFHECKVRPAKQSGLDRAAHGGCGSDPGERLAAASTNSGLRA